MCDEPDKKPDTEAAKPNKPGPPKKGPRKIIRSTATWANVFLPDFGRKGPGSVPDFDLRPTSVKSEQEKTGICSSCKGTGIMRCTFCLGTEFIKENGEAERCPACDGKVDVTCGVCFGAKKEIELVSLC